MPALKHRQLRRGTGSWMPVGLLALTIATDQLTKTAAERFLAQSGDVSLFGGLITFSLVQNYEGFLGIARRLPSSLQFFFLYVCVFILLSSCLFYIFSFRRSDPRYYLPLSLVAGGGLSNLLDRLLHNGGVIDFVILTAGTFHTGIFNLADVYILIGSFAFGFQLFSARSGERKP